MFKKIIYCFCLAGLPLFLGAQSQAVQDFYNKYKNQEDTEKVELKGWVLELASRFTDEAKGEKLLERITRLRTLTMKNGSLVDRSEYNRLVKAVRRDHFEDLMNIKDADDNIQIMIREKGETITDVLVLINGSDSFTLLSLEGKLKFSDLNDLHIDIDGAEHFEKVPERRSGRSVPRA